jgi:hypothetical protein
VSDLIPDFRWFLCVHHLVRQPQYLICTKYKTNVLSVNFFQVPFQIRWVWQQKTGSILILETLSLLALQTLQSKIIQFSEDLQNKYSLCGIQSYHSASRALGISDKVITSNPIIWHITSFRALRVNRTTWRYVLEDWHIHNLGFSSLRRNKAQESLSAHNVVPSGRQLAEKCQDTRTKRYYCIADWISGQGSGKYVSRGPSLWQRESQPHSIVSQWLTQHTAAVMTQVRYLKPPLIN